MTEEVISETSSVIDAALFCNPAAEEVNTPVNASGTLPNQRPCPQLSTALASPANPTTSFFDMSGWTGKGQTIPKRLYHKLEWFQAAF